MKYYTHTLHTRVKELKIYPHSSAFPLSYFSQPAPDGCIAYCLCFGILDQFVWENLEWNILLFGVAARHCWETDKPSNVTLSSRSAGWRQTRRSLRTQWLTLGGTPLQGMTPSCLAAKKLSLYDVGWSLYCRWLIYELICYIWLGGKCRDSVCVLQFACPDIKLEWIWTGWLKRGS